MAADIGYTFYCVCGNHEARPEDIETITIIYDKEIKGLVYIEPQFPNIRYFIDGGEYTINGFSVLVIGGAYSIDKWYRILRTGRTEENNNPKVTGWFANEMLTMAEMNEIANRVNGKHYDLILSHTCPIHLEPINQFLPMIDQTKVDKTMERFLERIYNITTHKIWLAGHHHIDRIEEPYFEFFYTDIEDLIETIWRWQDYNESGKLDWWLTKSPQFYWR